MDYELTCAGCAAVLRIPPNTEAATCTACGQRLTIICDGGAIFSRAAEARTKVFPVGDGQRSGCLRGQAIGKVDTRLQREANIIGKPILVVVGTIGLAMFLFAPMLGVIFVGLPALWYALSRKL